MSRVTSCRLPRVFKLPFARLSLSLLSSGSLRPPQQRLYLCALAAPSRVLRLSRTRFVSSPSRVRDIQPTRLERGAKYIVDTQQPPDRATFFAFACHSHHHCHRVLMLSYMICLTLPLAEPSGLSSSVQFFALFLRRACECNSDRKTCTLRN